MPFYNTQAPVYQGVDPRLIAQASQSPLTTMGKTMTELDNLISSRADKQFAKDRQLEAERQAQERLGISQQQADIASSNLALAGLEEQRKQDVFNRQQDALGLLEQDNQLLANLEAMKTFKPQQDELPSIPNMMPSGQSINVPMSNQARIMQEMFATGGKSPTLELDRLSGRGTTGYKGAPYSYHDGVVFNKLTGEYDVLEGLKQSSEKLPSEIREAQYYANLKKKQMTGNATKQEEEEIRYLESTKGGRATDAKITKLEGLRDELGNFKAYSIGSNGFNNLNNESKRKVREAIRTLEDGTSGKALISDLKAKVGDFAGMSETADRITESLGNGVDTNLWNKLENTLQTYTGISGLQNIKEQSIRSDVMSIGSIMLKLQSGATVTDKERTDFFNSMGSLGQVTPALLVGLRNKLSTALATFEGSRSLNPDLYDLKFGNTTRLMRESIAEADKNIAKYTKPKEKVNVDASKYSNAFR